jgi:hypothetical protein
MTPEELNRTIEFIIQSQARLAAAQEQDRRDRLEIDQRLIQLAEVQSSRMDRLDKAHADWLKRDDIYQRESLDFQRQSLDILRQLLDFQRESLDFQKEARRLLREIRDLMPPGTTKPN